ncbi:MAG: hypothetical protein M0Z64_08095 [Nitrospiraceae bacterium]|nr:hypothetical protein [Nitrospiraceae bacterium]
MKRTEKTVKFWPDLFDRKTIDSEITIADTPLSVIKTILSERQFHIKKIDHILTGLSGALFSFPLIMKAGVIKINRDKVSLFYKIPQEHAKVLKEIDELIQERKDEKFDIAFLFLTTTTFLIYNILDVHFKWHSWWINSHASINFKTSTLEITTYRVPDSELSSHLERTIETSLKALGDKAPSKEDCISYLKGINYITDSLMPLQCSENIINAIKDLSKGHLLKKCIYCDKPFFAKTKRRVYCSNLCKVEHFNRKSVLDQYVILSDGRKGVVKDIKKGYVLVNIGKETIKARLLMDRGDKDLPTVEEIPSFKRFQDYHVTHHPLPEGTTLRKWLKEHKE